MKERVKYLSLSAAESLYQGIPDNLERYRSENFRDLAEGGGWSAELSIIIDLAPLTDLDPDNSATADCENSIRLWRALGNLPPSVATENRLWVRLSHVECLDYSRSRWLEGVDEDALEDTIKKHMFAESLTQYRDDHAISRLWWNYYIASRIYPEEPEKALRLLLKTSDIRLNLIERPWIASRRSLCRGLVRLMTYDPWVTAAAENFRKMMRSINRYGGGVAFEVMQDREIDGFLMKSRRLAEELDF